MTSFEQIAKSIESSDTIRRHLEQVRLMGELIESAESFNPHMQLMREMYEMEKKFRTKHPHLSPYSMIEGMI